MQIFLSYASEHRPQAEAIAFAIRERGHSVFLDRDGLSAGEGYSSIIEDEIKRSDMMVFLIAPESVAPGRFTLTELEFARRHWRQANGRILPVMLKPTDKSLIPAYAKAVNIYTPRGSVAAEVAAEVDEQRGLEYALTVAAKLGAVGLVCGLLTWFSYKSNDGSAWWGPVLFEKHGPIRAPLNGLLFAFPIAFGAWWWGLRRWWVFAIPFFIIATSYWVIAPTISKYTYEVGKGSSRDPTLESKMFETVVMKIKDNRLVSTEEVKVLDEAVKDLNNFNIRYMRAGVAFIVALVLSFGAMLGLSLVLPAFRSTFRWLAVTAVATALSSLATIVVLADGQQHTIWKGVSLFTAWLFVFGFLIGYWLARGKSRVRG